MRFNIRRGALPFFFCLICFAGQTVCSLAAPAQQQKQSGNRTAVAAPAVQRNVPQPGGQQTVSPEALFAAMLVNAEKGQSQAMLAVGSLYEQGIGVPRNFTKAFEWYAKSANTGERAAWMRLGVCYEIGIGTTADMDKALAAYSSAASMGFAPGQYKLADMYLKGRGVAKDEEKGFGFLAGAAEGGEAAAMYDMGQVLSSGLFGRKAEPENARQWFTRAAATGHAGSILALAAMLQDGVGGKPDPEGALRWYLIGRKGGISGDALDTVIKELRDKKVPADKAREAEKAADAWIARRVKKQAGQGQ